MGDEGLTLSVAEAGRRLGIGRNLTYEGIRRGEIPVIRIGRRLLVPVKALQRLLDGTNVLAPDPSADAKNLRR